MRTFSIANQKGGCGKTTTAINLASSLARRNQYVLLVDCDPQAHATMGLGVEPDDSRCLYQVLMPQHSGRLQLKDITINVRKNFDLAPSSMVLSSIEHELAEVAGRENTLLRALQPVKRIYDYIILDCPPSIGHICFNALRASSDVIVPIDMSLFSLRGVLKLIDIILFLKNNLDHDIQIRALVTMFDFRTSYARRVLQKVREEFGENVFQSAIRYNIRLRETVDFGLPVADYDLHAIGHQDYERLADEVMAMKPLVAHHGAGALSGAQYMAQKAKRYIETAGAEQEINGKAAELDDLFDDGPESSYSEMIDVIASSRINFFGEDDEP